MCHYRLPGMAAALAHEDGSLDDRRPDADDSIPPPAEEHLAGTKIRAEASHILILEGDL